LDRNRIRAEFDRRFTAHHMAQNYLRLYSRLTHIRTPDSAKYEIAFLPGSALAAQAQIAVDSRSNAVAEA
jgi:hypothetical protein